MKAFKGAKALRPQRVAVPSETRFNPYVRAKTLTVKQIQAAKAQSAAEALTRNHDDLQDNGFAVDTDEGGWDDDEMEISNSASLAKEILNGEKEVNISHEGGETYELFESLSHGHKRRHKDYRTRFDRTERRNLAFAAYLESMTKSYMDWSLGVNAGGNLGKDMLLKDAPEGWLSHTLRIVDMFSCDRLSIYVDPANVLASLVAQGLYPCSPLRPSVVVTTRTLEHYRVLYLRCPRVTVQPFVKALCDLHGVPYQPYLREQFSICFDLYLSILNRTKSVVRKSLGHDGSNWRLENACPACLYKVAGEKQLKFSLMGCMDGGDSLKRVARRALGVDEEGNMVSGTGPSQERQDSRIGGGDYYLTREEVDRWAKGIAKEILAELAEEDTPCSPRWKNMNEKLTASMWGVFEETGVFLCLCRHGFVLLIEDMVRSGEQAKYALAIVDRLIEVLGEDLAIGYDIGCGFKTTIARSALGAKAKEKRFTSLVGTFHGHAHCRLCQTDHLGTYVEGNGLEDSEGCERFFSKSNALASSVRYASVFHRRQAIAAYAEHTDDFETYANLPNFLLQNYKQALEIRNGLPTLLQSMQALNIDSVNRFPEWLAEERQYLMDLKKGKVPEEETLKMEYFRRLVDLEEAEKILRDTNNAWLLIDAGPSYEATARNTRKLETKRRQAAEVRDDMKAHCHLLEQKLGISARWQSGTNEWEETKALTEMAKYQKCVDKLESLIVARLFELTKMNMSQTGYKLRKHIGQALKTRSQAIRTALDNYNKAALALKPPRPQLDWDTVIDCCFLSDFDILRDTRQDVRQKRWSEPAVRVVMDKYFKYLRAGEEIERLDVEITRLVTYLYDEDEFLLQKIEEHLPTNPALANQIRIYHERRGRFWDKHWKTLRKIAKLPGFSGSLQRGRGKLSPTKCYRNPRTVSSNNDNDSDGSEEEQEEEEDAVNILEITQDRA
ncbi:hypothetical protein VKT23_018416 [Stygiomarasmius scandens]|uniref:CxC1-like cysteine cluster associated with KDZ transposases domain-containing protein n=1 Tax=Marasmiellus scandens TaxID=2682957 RepID=A0ABR1ITL2_9AGAR